MAGEVDKIDSLKEVHHLSARKELKSEMDRREKTLRGDTVQNPDALGGGSFRPLDRVQDVPTMRKELKDYKRNYEKGAPVALSPQTKDKLWIEAKRLKDEFIIGMVSKTDMHPVKPRTSTTPSGLVVNYVCDYDKLRDSRAIERNRAWLSRNQVKINRFKNIMRLLEPDDPNIANIERFRK